ncbi:hypothetical protein [Lihuaxuella thermophila]|uniref:Uncharacterized protein n=1 Tax=Lihuaxuella thermophila TaxID=1173111 RepID=A0A1H8H415_9BACL|nr:hypothetical protein [Lihuaxuella thermophila]SEN51092.1 hypothetical protein SAMN05444955_11336 [Lihuaxuella thermophila]
MEDQKKSDKKNLERGRIREWVRDAVEEGLIHMIGNAVFKGIRLPVKWMGRIFFD